jgi:hypothetical protein
MHRHLNNNTPVNTEVLWGGGVWWGLWAGAPGAEHDQHVIDVDNTITIFIAGTSSCRTTFCDDLLQILNGGLLLIMHGQ